MSNHGFQEQQSTQLYEALQQIITQQIQYLQQIQPLMQEEREAISQADVDSLNQILEKKQPLIIHLQQLDKQREQLLICEGMQPDAETFRQLIAQSDNTSLKQQWQQLLELLKRCKHENEVNGRLIFMKKHNVDALLKVLLGNWQTTSQTYSAMGQTESSSRSGICAVA